MRFKKGCKVEVFDKKEVPYGAWRCGKIMSGNGHTYSVSSECPPGIQNVTNLRRVPRKAIRPCPPAVDCMENWTNGDMVEVFDDFSWKIAKVLQVVVGDYYLVRILGSSKEVQVQKANIRQRQAWQDNEWIVIGKGYSGDVLKFNKMATLTCFPKIGFPLPQADRKLEMHSPNSILEIRRNSSFPVSHVIAGGTLKRALPFLSSNVQAHHGNAKKRRAVEREGQCKQVTSGYQCSLNKVDVVPCPHESAGETYMHSSHKNQTNDLGREIQIMLLSVLKESRNLMILKSMHALLVVVVLLVTVKMCCHVPLVLVVMLNLLMFVEMKKKNAPFL